MSANVAIKKIEGWLQPLLTKAFSDSLSKWVFYLLLLTFAWMLGQFGWLLAGRPEISLASSPDKSAKTEVSTQKTPYQLDQLINLDLFGGYKSVSSLSGTEINAPRTNLTLTLVGLVANSSPSRGLAVIDNSGAQEIYGIGDKITGTAVVLRQVLADRVILSNNGRDEALMLEGVDYSKNAQVTPEQKTTQPKAAGKVDLSSIKAEILKTPQSLLKFITLSQERGPNGIVGYRLGPGSDSRLFKESGLKTGDVAVSINGLDLTDPSLMNKIWQNLSDASEISLSVRRDGQLHKIYIGL